MSDQASPETDLLRAAYAAFNARDIDAAFAVMSADVAWPMAFKGGVARGHEEVRAYWTEQWAEVDPHVDPHVDPVSFDHEGAGRVLVQVHQVVRHLDGDMVFEGRVDHRFTVEDGLVRAMELCPIAKPGK